MAKKKVGRPRKRGLRPYPSESTVRAVIKRQIRKELKKHPEPYIEKLPKGMTSMGYPMTIPPLKKEYFDRETKLYVKTERPVHGYNLFIKECRLTTGKKLEECAKEWQKLDKIQKEKYNMRVVNR